MEIDEEVAVFQMLSKGHQKMGKRNGKLPGVSRWITVLQMLLEGCNQDKNKFCPFLFFFHLQLLIIKFIPLMLAEKGMYLTWQDSWWIDEYVFIIHMPFFHRHEIWKHRKYWENDAAEYDVIFLFLWTSYTLRQDESINVAVPLPWNLAHSLLKAIQI